MAAELRIENLSKSFGETAALQNVSLRIQPGQFYGLFGPSGAGKTTLLRCVAGLETPDSGSVRIDGEDITRMKPAQRNAAMVFDNYALYPHLSVYENIAYPLREQKLPQQEIRKRVQETAETLGIQHTLQRKPQTLSGGEMQRAAIARAAVKRARVYLLDEPISHLDAQLREKMRVELKRLHRQLNAAFIYATPDQLEALTLPDQLALLNNGQIVQTGRPTDLYDRPKHLFAAQQLGDPPMNLIPGRVLPDGAFQAGAFRTPPLNAAAPPGDALLGVRPEDIQLSANPPPERTAFRAGVLAAEMRGDYTVVTLNIERNGSNARIQVLVDQPRANFQYNREIDAHFNPNDAYVFNPNDRSAAYPDIQQAPNQNQESERV